MFLPATVTARMVESTGAQAQAWRAALRMVVKMAPVEERFYFVFAVDRNSVQQPARVG